MKGYLYDLENGIIYKKPKWTSRQAMTQLAMTFNEKGFYFALWDEGLREGKMRGNVIAENLPYTLREYAIHFGGFKSQDFALGD